VANGHNIFQMLLVFTKLSSHFADQGLEFCEVGLEFLSENEIIYYVVKSSNPISRLTRNKSFWNILQAESV